MNTYIFSSNSILGKASLMNTQDVNETMQYFESIFTIDNNGIVIVDHKGIILRVNPAFTKILGYEEHEIVGKPFYILAYKSQKLQQITSHNSLHRFYCAENLSMEMTLFDREGRDIPVRFRSVLIRDNQGQLKQAIGMIEHMLELTGTGEGRSSLAEKMWEAQQNFENVLNTSADAIIICDISGTIMMANKAFSQMLDYNQEEVLGKHIVEFTAFEEGTYTTSTGEEVIIDGEYVIYTASKSAELFEKGYVSGWESYLVRKDKVHVPTEITMSILKDKDGERRGSIVILRDITERRKAEIENKKSREFLENIFKTTADGILVTNDEGIITMINESVEKIFGYSKGELVGKATGILQPEGKKYHEIVKDYLSILFKKGVVTSFEFEYLKKDGSLVEAEVNSALLKDDKGNITGSVTSIRDITERRKAETEIIETRNFLEDIFNTTADGIMVTDSQGCIVRVNRAIEQMLGFRGDELVGKYTNELGTQSEASKKASAAMLEELFEKGFVNNFEAAWYRKDKSLCPVEMSITFIRDKEGNLSGAVGAIRDITERKKAEKALKEERDFSNRVIETADVLITGVDLEGKILIFNRKAEEVTGYSREEVMGNDFVKILVPEEGRSAFAKLIEEIKKESKTINPFDVSLITKKGEVRIILSRGTPLTNVEGEVVGVLGIGLDVTESRKMERQLLQSEKLKSLGELSGGVAHDFNNILAAILGRVQLLKMQLKPPCGMEYKEKRKSVLELEKGLEIIERASLDGAETVRRIQEFSRRRADDKDFTQVDINELIDNAIEFTKVKWKNEAESKGIKIEIKKELSMLTPTLGSPSELREVFTNLINNAIDAMPEGGKIRVKSFMDYTSAVITIEDTGGGIPRNIKDRIFDPFFTTKGPQSSGLGLSVSYGIVNRHHGTITAESIEGKGTTFTLKFAVTKKTGKGEVKEGKVIAIKGNQKKARILVIDDEEDVRELLRDILTNAGHEVEVATNGNEGIEIFAKEKYDLVLTDLGMPVMSGWEVAEKVKSMNKNVPVALITGWNVALDDATMNNSGIHLIIHKPFQMEQILNLVQEGMILKDQLKAV